MTKELAIQILRGEVLGTNEQTHEAVFMAIKALKNEQKHGKWIAKAVSIKGVPTEACSECCEWSYGDGKPFCPNCGVKMDDDWEEPEINPCRGCNDYDGRGGCKSNGGCGAADRSEE